MKSILLHRSAFAITAAGLVMSTVLGQAPGTGAIRGTVYDPSGLAIQNAHVTAVSETTEATRTEIDKRQRNIHIPPSCSRPIYRDC